MFFVSDAMAAGEAAAQVGGMEGFLMQVVPLVVIFAVFWFFLIRPQQKRQKEHMQMCEGPPAAEVLPLTVATIPRIATSALVRKNNSRRNSFSGNK